MFNFIEKLEKEEKEYLEGELQENIEVLYSTIKDMTSIVKSKKDKKEIIYFISCILSDFDFSKTEKYNFKDLKSEILKKTNYINDHIEGRVQTRLSDIKQKSFDNENIRNINKKLQKENEELEKKIKELEKDNNKKVYVNLSDAELEEKSLIETILDEIIEQEKEMEKSHKIKVMQGGQRGGKNFFKNLFSNNKK